MILQAIGTDPGLEGVRPYTTNIAHGYHSDNSDFAGAVMHPPAAKTARSEKNMPPSASDIHFYTYSRPAGLLCLRDAEEGGISNWASSIAVHNALLRRGRKVRS